MYSNVITRQEQVVIHLDFYGRYEVILGKGGYRDHRQSITEVIHIKSNYGYTIWARRLGRVSRVILSITFIGYRQCGIVEADSYN